MATDEEMIKALNKAVEAGTMTVFKPRLDILPWLKASEAREQEADKW